ncbi:LysM peptidoglycan-binding domain-containing protein [Streptococcus minor]|uniref:LysM peptidoglycan-binding domain-containing protein n=1 Tax=Streptococcus minor TaxID=229549 RepID=A0A3P1V8L1_9STRE|nr:LysM domain-containing protein [Streptococcus minor]MDO5078014.1 LysM peptidoglycan-binding domain-containing protein [Streptococcus minor]RRD30499.1 LysM peptidoglycan-binding domain-containing protein [Streptococcus minor]
MTFSKTKYLMASFLLISSFLLPASIQAETYTVKPGDTLSQIASAFHTTVDELAYLNQIENKNLIMIGQVLKTNQAMTAATEQVVNSIAKPAQTPESVSVVASQTPEVQPGAEYTTPAPAQTIPVTVGGYTSELSPEEAAAKEEIARRESGGSYTAQNGQFYGRYQLMLTYLNGDLSPENQERVADAYVRNRYGSWVAALAHSNAKGWY